MRIGIISLGCPKNLVDSEIMMGLLLEDGQEIVHPDEADVVVINTCAFIRAAEDEAEEVISEILADKGDRKLIVAGCLAQRYGRSLFDRFPDVDAVLGTGEFQRIAHVVRSLGGSESKITFIGQPEYLYDHLTPRFLGTPPHYAYIKIAEGCSNACSFCAIPRLRGRYRSREFDSVLSEATALAEAGVKELVLVSQDTTGYGLDLYGLPMLADLLSELAEIEGPRWIRFLYSYPSRIEERLLEVMAENDRICKYLDMPIQHIHDDILSKMRREGGEREIRKAVRMARELIPDVTLRTTVIVGFPGEEENHFRSLLRFLEEVEFDHLGVFAFSPEEGTPAARMEGQVPEEVKLERLERVVELQAEIAFRRRQRLTGRKVEILLEGFDPERNMAFGRAEFQAPEIDDLVFVRGVGRERAERLRGSFIKARIEGVCGYDLIAEVEGSGI
ncbi:TPA: 30S ribosomal protein S12 methylthiotransferase RimO [Candidatus Poribacteria bacterium]|nr:30S ribosomal protein S12 methylthiotransferase RimO [Candidatus Poribacteria bacterium]